MKEKKIKKLRKNVLVGKNQYKYGSRREKWDKFGFYINKNSFSKKKSDKNHKKSWKSYFIRVSSINKMSFWKQFSLLYNFLLFFIYFYLFVLIYSFKKFSYKFYLILYVTMRIFSDKKWSWTFYYLCFRFLDNIFFSYI